jgi:hypothetical protein
VDTKRLRDGHAALVGYALDGFGIFGHYGEGGKPLSSADLDDCHGHTHMIEWNGRQVMMYHYHATWDFPYTIGCMRGAVRMSDVMKISGSRHMQQQPHGMNGGREGEPHLATAASKLGVSEDELRQALGLPPPNLATAAARLGISEQTLRGALGPPP